MKSVLALLIALSISLALGATAAPVERDAVVTGNTAFALELYGQLRTQEGNLFCSPYSLSTALAMAYGGARGETAAQMAKVLRFDLAAAGLHPAFATLAAELNAIQQKGQVKLAIANSLWPQHGCEFLPAYLDLCQKQYGVAITPLDFAKATESARQTINAWVENKTNKKIQELFPPGVLDPMTRLVLVNAIYFKGTWASPFDPQLTKTVPFQVSAGSPVNAPLMQLTKKFRYAESPELQVLELPYAGNDLAMVVLLPRTGDGLAALEKSLTPAKLAAWTTGWRSREVQLWLPKFKTTSQFSLNQTLATLGMTNAFTDQADFSGMDGKKDLLISAVVHKAFVEVNEEGTEAAAATGISIAATSFEEPQPPVLFRADHPFLFLIRDNQTGSILFLGRIVDPRK